MANFRDKPEWMRAANCLVTELADTRFIREPDEGEAKEWRRICRQCPVSQNCLDWADKHKVIGVFIAGEWREQ